MKSDRLNGNFFKDKNIISIKILLSGDIIVNNEDTIPFKELQAKLLQLKEKQGMVWFYREGSQFQPNEPAMEVFDFIIRNKLPISLSSKPDFSDYIDENGNSFPRSFQE